MLLTPVLGDKKAQPMETLLSIRNLHTYFYTHYGVVKAVEGVNLEIQKGEILGLVGESGCGKSVTALSIMRLIPNPPGKIVEGEIIFKQEDLLEKSEEEMRKIRGNEISMIFQEPMTSLDPVFTVGEELTETIGLHRKLTRARSKGKAIEMLKKVGIPESEKRMNEYPHQLSGGMQQRVMIGMALCCNPSLLIADEPTTALDVTIQAQILKLIKDLQKDFGTAILLITHDLGVIAENCSQVAVMYAGNIVEYAGVEPLFEKPLHPYTVALSKSIPRLDVTTRRLKIIKGMVPNLVDPPRGCKFHPRCEKAFEICSQKSPLLTEVEKGHEVRCWLYS
jgi:oligopeptide/dipeptide ABC transporter ATP-binding protein